jgi:aspartate dehydrogenase
MERIEPSVLAQSYQMIKVGLVGAGAIGTELALYCKRYLRHQIKIQGIIDHHPEKETLLRKRLGLRRYACVEDLIPDCSLIIEAASSAAAFPLAKLALSSGKDALLMSTSGLVPHIQEIQLLLKKTGGRLFLPSGAVTGVDALKSACSGKIQSVTLVTRKSPKGLKSAPFIASKGINLNRLRKETLVYQGSAKGAIQGFPQNINIAATLSLAGVGARKTKVKIYASPGLRHHVHELQVTGDFGTFVTKTKNVPTSKNPKTSRLAVYSAASTLKSIASSLQVGT